MTKQYDKAYFDRWYRARNTRVNSSQEIRRKVTMAVSIAEYFLQRPIRNALDVGCGEGAWRAHLLALRPALRYQGLDASDYVVRRFGSTRNIRKATFADLPSLDLGVFDLVVCSDVLHYVPERELRAGLPALAGATDGLAYLEVLTRDDEIVGDLDSLIRRPAVWYRNLFRSAGLTFAGPYCWLAAPFAEAVARLESGT